MRIILASASPRRRELLAKMGLDFEVIPSKGEEHITKQEPIEIVKELSFRKAKEIADLQTDDCLVIGADTIVVKDGAIMGKPRDEAEAFRMISRIAGQSHQVYTGVTLIYKGTQPKELTFSERTDVFVYPMTEADIRDYITGTNRSQPDRADKASTPIRNTNNPQPDWADKAGAYGIQGDFAIHIEKIEGDYYNVVGLPIGRLYRELKQIWEV